MAYDKASYERNRESILRRNREWRRLNYPYERWRKIKERYGITREDYEAILAKQNGRCAICLTNKPVGKGGMLHVDHDHDTNVVRGLLCYPCNTRLGWYETHSGNIAAYVHKGRM